MSHVRQQIRDYASALLTKFIFDRFGIEILDRFNVQLSARLDDKLISTGTLYKFRRYALDDAQLPALIVYTTNDVTNLATMGSRTLSHNLELRVDVINKGSSVNIFENIESFCAELNSAIEADYSFNGLVKSCILTQSDFSVNTTGEKAIGTGKMIFEVRYMTAINNCQVSI
jgi:hypothetical protein